GDVTTVSNTKHSEPAPLSRWQARAVSDCRDARTTLFSNPVETSSQLILSIRQSGPAGAAGERSTSTQSGGDMRVTVTVQPRVCVAPTHPLAYLRHALPHLRARPAGTDLADLLRAQWARYTAGPVPVPGCSSPAEPQGPTRGESPAREPGCAVSLRATRC